jgi:hypothetical protein
VVKRHTQSVLPPGKTRYPLQRRLGGPQGRYGRVQKISPLPDFDPQTVYSVASRYTGSRTKKAGITLERVFKNSRSSGVIKNNFYLDLHYIVYANSIEWALLHRNYV